MLSLKLRILPFKVILISIMTLHVLLYTMHILNNTWFNVSLPWCLTRQVTMIVNWRRMVNISFDKLAVSITKTKRHCKQYSKRTWNILYYSVDSSISFLTQKCLVTLNILIILQLKETVKRVQIKNNEKIENPVYFYYNNK